MKIICTNEEKQAFLNAYEFHHDLPCLLAKMEVGCATKYESCKECLEKKIEWKIKEKTNDD